MIELATIESFLSPKKLAIIGVSRNPKKFGRQVYDTLKEKGFTVYGVNPNAENLIHNLCILMYASPVKGPHKFHRFLNKVFGKYPK